MLNTPYGQQATKHTILTHNTKNKIRNTKYEPQATKQDTTLKQKTQY